MSSSAVVPSSERRRAASRRRSARAAVVRAPSAHDSVETRLCDNGKLLYFFHLPKTGGRTVERHISHRFGIHKVFHPRKHKSAFADLFMSAKIAAPTAAENMHITGHYAPLSLLRGREQHYYKACFWRHPADWFLSFYNYRRFRQAARLKRPFGFDDFQKSMLRNPMTEHLLLYCGGVPGWTYFLMSDKAKFEAACALIEEFDYFADVAEVDNFVRAIGYREGQRPADYNRIPSRQKALPGLDEPARQDIERTNSIDFYLHRLALAADRQQIREDARHALRSSFNVSDVFRLIAMPYFRFKIWVVPFLPTLDSMAPRRARAAKGVHVADTYDSAARESSAVDVGLSSTKSAT